ncbi:MAG: 2-C-methyl-D-erythritol 4-phosphate cytidylyltransferase [Acidimicrobiales bacterium]
MVTEHEVWTIVVAAGSGQRFGANKLDQMLTGNQTVLDATVAVSDRHSTGVIVVLRAEDPRLGAPSSRNEVRVAGGATRSESARAGLAAVPHTADIVLIHDAARPLASDGVFQRVLEAVQGGAAAAVPAVPVVDTIRSKSGESVDRDSLRAVQTPQGFSAAVLREAHSTGAEATDDAVLVEACGHEVVLVDGDVRNLKITNPADLDVARALIAGKSSSG